MAKIKTPELNDNELYEQFLDRKFPVFAHDYNTEHEACEFLGYLLAMNPQCKHVVEIGIFEGRTSLELIKHLPKDGTITLIDINDFRCPMLKAVCEKDKRVKFIQGNSLKVLPQLAKEGFKADFFFFDSVHEYQHQVAEFQAAERIASEGAIHAFHDSIHIEGVLRFVNWMRQWYHVVNLNTTENRGLAIARRGI
jgi:predicted O-methyltransferase YrrM